MIFPVARFYTSTFIGQVWSPCPFWHIEAQNTLDEYHRMRELEEDEYHRMRELEEEEQKCDT